ncbi:hypothetical protein [Pseudomonas fulva]|uniref:hypothetical protein n=1 Tax=Pseudomonas fulva TaxID=47880 RepID=UPI0015E3CB2A|nr:hypothetical protein [Pseudomonas fulva]MBA1215871.1 hypothetical protein [Pseudomonas fulva]
MTPEKPAEEQNPTPEAYELKMARERPAFLNQEMLDSIARDHAGDLIKIGSGMPTALDDETLLAPTQQPK